MSLFSSWFHRSSRTEHKRPAAPVSTTPLNIFKGFKLGRRDRERGDPQPSETAKKPIPNRPNRPEIRVLTLVLHIPVGIPRDPPPLPPKASGTRLLNPRQHAGQHQQMQSETETNISRRVFSSTSPFRIVEPRIADNNRAHILPEATITLHRNTHRNLQRRSRTAQSSAVFSQSDSPHPTHSLSSLNPTALEVGDWPNPPQPLSIHPPVGPSSLQSPVTASSIYEGGISTSGAAEQEKDVPPPQESG